MKLASLKNKSDFDLIFEKNNLKVSSGEFEVLLVFKNKKEINYGFVFPKKNINLAVNRNFAKRSAKEMLKTLNPKKGLKRTLNRKNNEDRYENYNLEFHYKVREAFLSVAKKNKKRIVILDGNLSKEVLHKQIIENINKLGFLKKKLPFTIE